MEIWYAFGEKLLPFSWAEHHFMLNALLAVLIVTPLFGMLGTMVVNNHMAFFSDTIGHSALTGIGIGVILGLHQPLGAMVLFAIFMAVAVSFVKELTMTSTDTVIGVFSAVAVALGIVILSRGGGFNKYSGYLIGDILSITPEDIFLIFMITVLFIGYWYYSFNSLVLLTVHPSLARSRGVNARRTEMVFTVALAVIVTVSIQWLGIMIINSLLVLPAASSRNFSRNIRQYHLLTIIISLVSGITGLILSFYWDTASGATIVLVAAFFFIISFIKKQVYG
ncbi:metal ABC transporter permease [Dehalobacterium formicoaceticum]|uniref:Metal ABC transporter permease n=1 Tax=Dehalobacterium formicoaceticum TaxID=51515 RepID=A0ABT1XZP2_9FIRM|nr:metal ABC transporter permease [Dehalobacterium formicoaceticum]MCR6544084.1 metal ABC transporter permease [Dehalobacterium formicoaceticum]